MRTILVMASTLDGKIARDKNHHVDWTGKGDRKIFVQLTRDAGAVIMGRNTFDTLGSPLPGRKNIVMTRKGDAVPGDRNLIFTARTPGEILTDLDAQGYETAALIGGAQVNSLFLRENLIDEIYLTIVPKLFGTGISIFSEEAEVDLTLTTVSEIDNGALLLHYILN